MSNTHCGQFLRRHVRQLDYEQLGYGRLGCVQLDYVQLGCVQRGQREHEPRESLLLIELVNDERHA